MRGCLFARPLARGALLGGPGGAGRGSFLRLRRWKTKLSGAKERVKDCFTSMSRRRVFKARGESFLEAEEAFHGQRRKKNKLSVSRGGGRT